MTWSLGFVRRWFTAGGIALVAITALPSPAQAAAAQAAGIGVDPVGHPAVVVWQSEPGRRAPGRQESYRPLLPMNEAGLAEAKRRAADPAHASSPALTTDTTTSAAPLAGISGGLDSAGVSAADEGYCCVPPDTTGAIGPNHYVEFVNTTIRVNDRNLKQVSQADMATFVGAASGLNVSDPQVQWDQRGGRWFYAGVAFASHNNYLVFGWSKTADPSDLGSGWCHFGVFLGNSLPDYPKLGHDDNFVIFGANLYDDTTGKFVFTTAEIWALPKPAAGSTACAANGFTAFADARHPLKNADGSLAFTPVPANTSDASGTGYVVAAHTPVPENSPPLGPQTKLMTWHLVSQGGTPQLVADGDLTVASFGVPANVPQPNAPAIDSLDARLTMAVAHADPDAGGAEAVWTQHTIAGASGRSVVRWYELLPATRAVRQQGAVQSSTDFVFNGAISPSIAGNDAAVFYNRGGSAQLPVIGAQSRLTSTPLGTMIAGELPLGSSTDADVDFSCSAPYGPPCRWGDYSGASPDPLNPGVVWGSSQVSGPAAFGFPQWSTQNFAVATAGTPPTPCTGVTMGASPASPQTPGPTVTFTAAASGCPQPSYEFWLQPPGGAWQILQAYGTSPTASWSTAGQPAGTYLLDVWARDASSAAAWDAHISPNPTYTLQSAPPCTSVTMGASPASPQFPGPLVTFTASAAGCSSPSYEFWIQPPGGAWQVLQAYSSTSSATWNTSGQPSGTYLLDVWARQSGSSAAWEAHISPNPTYTLQAQPCTGVTMTASPASPQLAGPSVTFSATATGCSAPTYEFWIQPPGGAWQVLQAYSAQATATWNTSGQPSGTYQLDVWVKQSGSSAAWEAHISPNPTYTIQAPPPCTGVTMTAAPASPQVAGAVVTFAAAATGCSTPTYQFWVLPPGGAWQILQAYSPSSTATWRTDGQPAGTWLLDVWVRQSGSGASWEAHISPNPSYVLQPAPPCTGVTMTASPASPQTQGAAVTFSATATGCSLPTYEFWVQPPGGAWQILQAYSSSSTATWNTAGQPAGTWSLDVWVRQSGSGASWETHLSSNPTYTLLAVQPCTGVTMGFSPSSPQPPGPTVSLSATATGCTAPTYQFWVQPPGGAWQILQAYGNSATASWNTAGQPAGTYLFDVWVRQYGSSASWEAHISPNPTYTLSP